MSKKKRLHHKQARANIGGNRIWVDAELVPLIEEMNKVGLATSYSCQGDKVWTRSSDLAYVCIDLEKLRLFHIGIDLENKRLDIHWHRDDGKYAGKPQLLLRDAQGNNKLIELKMKEGK